LATVSVGLLLWLSEVSGQSSPTVAALPLKHVIRIGDRVLGYRQSAEITLPALPARPGAIVVLRFRAVSYSGHRGGCNYNATLTFNGVPLGRYTEGGSERMVGRSAMFKFGAWRGGDEDWQIFSGAMIRIMFAPDVDTGDGMTRDGQGASFALDISDVARGVDGNVLEITNTRPRAGVNKKRDLIVRGIEIGWLDKSLLAEPPDRRPSRTAMRDGVSLGELRLAQGAAGGFSICGSEGVELLVETALSMDRKARSALTADDALHESSPVKVIVVRESTAGYRVTADWPEVTLVRTLRLADDLLHWQERWTNTGKTIPGVPFRHRLFLREESARFLLAGDPDINTLAACATNPSLFLESRVRRGNGIALLIENDWGRLLSRLSREGGMAELYTQDLALPPGGSIDIALTATPVRDGGGYWTFINRVRQRWGVNGGTAERPFFWSWGWARGKTREEALKKTLGRLGPVTVMAWLTKPPWARMGYDRTIVASERYPKLPRDVPRTPGRTPDLDVDAFLTFEHWEEYWQDYADFVALVHRAAPNAQVVQGMEMAHDVVYAPMGHRWPYAADKIVTAKGKHFESAYYSRAYLGDLVDKDWKSLYYVPRAGSAYLASRLRDVRRSMDDCGGDGLYLDEFSFGDTRGYSRYDYSRWDGYSADLNETGKVLRLKSDNAFTSESAQIQIATMVRRRGKFLLGNGGAMVRSGNTLRVLRYTEGGNGVGAWPRAHLSTVPLVLGNFGDSTTRQGVFRNVRTCVENGCVYSPCRINLGSPVLDGPDNFVCKLYPITIRAIGPGLIEGEQRLVATRSGEFDWPGRDAAVTLYAYDGNGDLMDRQNLPQVQVNAARPLDITVPPKGLVIAEAR